MSDLTRRQVLKIGATGAMLPLPWTAAARANSAAPAQVLAAGDMALWYDEPAGSDWLRALPIGNGRLGAMVFGNTDTERLQLNEDTVWAGGPHDPSNPRGQAALAEIRRLVFANQWTQAQDLINQTMMGNPGGQLAYQTVGNLRLAFPTGGVSQYDRQLDLTTATTSVTYVVNGVRYQREVFASAPRPGHREAPDRRPVRVDHLHRHLRQPATHLGLQPGRHHHRPRRRLRQPGGRHRCGPFPRPRQRHGQRRQRDEFRWHAQGHQRDKRHPVDLDRLQLRQLPQRQRPGRTDG